MINREDEVIRTLTRYYTPHPRLPVPSGADDATMITEIPGRTLVLSVDAHMEGIHFERSLLALVDVGYRALAAALSDLAAMGARPITFLVNLEVPLTLSLKEISDIYEGFKPLMKRFCISPSGGNITRSERIGLVITVVGETSREGYLPREVRAGDLLAVSGDLGRSMGGLYLLQNRSYEEKLQEEDAQALIEKFLQPVPRIHEMERLLGEFHPRGGMDLSDGLGIDAGRLARLNQVDLVFYEEQLPLHPATLALAEVMQLPPSTLATSSGEEYEILLAIDPSDREHLEKLGGWTIVGEARASFEPRAVLKRKDGSEVDISQRGFDHLMESFQRELPRDRET